MNATHFHLLLNHFPIIGTLIGSGLLLWGIARRQQHLKPAGATILVLMTALALPVYFTGEPAEDTVENINGISESMIELHEKAATVALVLLSIAAAFSIAALVMHIKQHKTANMLFAAAFAVSVISFAAMARTGYYGGKIRHTELNSAAAAPADVKGTGAGEGSKQKEKDDDD